MTWDLFSYICRKVSVDCEKPDDLTNFVDKVKKADSASLYGNNLKGRPQFLIDNIVELTDKARAKEIISIYATLNLNKLLEEPLKIKRVISYLFYVAIVFYIVVASYQFHVTPSLIEAFDNLQTPVPDYLLLYQQYWVFFVLLISLLLLLALAVSLKIRKLFEFSTGGESGLVFKYFIFSKAKRSYKRIVEIIEFPVNSEKGLASNDSIINRHLESVKKSKLNLSVEMQALIDIEMRALIVTCEKQMKSLSILTALIVIAAVFFFLVSAYSPIFILGDVI